MVKQISHRDSLSGVVAASLLSLAPSAFAQHCPDKDRPMEIVVGFALDGFTDVLAGAVAPKLKTSLRTPVVVDDKAGATGTIGSNSVAKSDEHTQSVRQSMGLGDKRRQALRFAGVI